MESSQDINIRELCALCQSLPCCPEHCCDWDSCHCSHCNSRRNSQVQQPSNGQQQLNTDPTIFIKSTGTEEVKKIKKRKLKKDQQIELPEKDKELHLPSEQVRANDGALIINYEVVLEEEEDKIVYSGGVRGIRALRQQRDVMNHQIEDDLLESKNKYERYEQNPRNQIEESKR